MKSNLPKSYDSWRLASPEPDYEESEFSLEMCYTGEHEEYDGMDVEIDVLFSEHGEVEVQRITFKDDGTEFDLEELDDQFYNHVSERAYEVYCERARLKEDMDEYYHD